MKLESLKNKLEFYKQSRAKLKIICDDNYWWYIGKFICLETNDILDNFNEDIDRVVKLYNECEAL